MIQQYQARKFQGSSAERRKVMENVGHLLNRLRTVAEEAGQPLTGKEEGDFWAFLSILPKESQTSIIN